MIRLAFKPDFQNERVNVMDCGFYINKFILSVLWKDVNLLIE